MICLRLRRYTPPKHSSNVILVLSSVYRLRQKPHVRSFLAPSFTHIHNEYTTVILRIRKLTQRIHIVSNVNLPPTHMCSAFGATPPIFPTYIHQLLHTFTPHSLHIHTTRTHFVIFHINLRVILLLFIYFFYNIIIR